MGAAPRSGRLRAPFVLGLILLAAGVLASAPAATAADRAGSALPPEVWAIELGAATQGLDLQELKRLRGRGLNTVLLNATGLTPRRAAKLRARAVRAGLLVLPICQRRLGQEALRGQSDHAKVGTSTRPQEP